MKFFAVIWAFYLTALFAMPCADSIDRDHAHDLPAAMADTHSDPTDQCTPMCACNCCGVVSGIVFEWNTFTFKEPYPFGLAQPSIRYTSTFVPGYYEDIWQPPKHTA